VPVMLLVVRLVNRTQGWYEARPGIPGYEECCPAMVHIHGGHVRS
jgi:ACR3 family arsenite transporter